MGPWQCLVLVLLLSTASAQTSPSLTSSNEDSSAGASSTSSTSDIGQHHTQITVTGVEVGLANTNGSVPSPSPTPQQPNLLGEIISAASGEANGTSIAQVLDKALAKEFEQESKNAESGQGKTFNETVASDEATVETVVRISAGKPREKEDSAASSSSTTTTGGNGSTPSLSGSASSGHTSSSNTSSSGSSGSTPGPASSGSHSSHADDVPTIEKGVDRIIDSHDNEFVLSAPPKDQVATLTLDPLLIQDLTCLFASAALMGMLFESMKQPVINGYLVAGAIVGPGGLQLIKELVQVESLAQLGVQLLLFHLGRELSFSKLKSVWQVALLGGSLQIVALSALGGAIAAAVESPITQGVFVGALLSMSSTSVVVKCLETCRMNGTAFGQIVIGTLILQDCSVGIMFALMPAFGAAAASQAAAADPIAGVASALEPHAALIGITLLVAQVLMKLLLLLAAAWAVAKLLLPTMLQLLLRHASKELVQLCLVSTCLSMAWLCGKLGLSEELGAFIAGAMMSMAEQRLVATGQLLPSSAPHTPGSKGHMSAPDSPPELASTPTKIGVGKHNPAAMAYYRHATQQRQQQPHQGKSSFHDAEAGAGVAVHELDSASLTAHLHALHQQQHQALLAGQPLNLHGSSDTNGAAGGGGAGGSSALSHQQQHPVNCSTEQHQSPNVCANIESIQNVLTALFVASMGLIMSPVFLWHHAAVLMCGALVVTLVKAAVVTLVVRLFGVPVRLSLAVGLSMAHIGEFSFVLLSMANQLKLLSAQVYMLLLGVTAMSLLTTPFVILATIHLLGKDGHYQACIAAPRLLPRLSCDRD